MKYPSADSGQLEFLEELREFFEEDRVRQARKQLLAGNRRPGTDARQVLRWLGERRWLAPSWPEEYGGLGRSPVDLSLVHQELVAHGFPDLGFVVSICYVGNFLLLAAGDRVKSEFLPRLAAGTLSACTLYSEPGAGSDLGSLAAEAVPTVNGFRLSGRKIFSQATEHADYALVAARLRGATGAKQAGITLFWVPLRAPGVRVAPVLNLSDDPFADVTLDNVEVAADQVVGPPGEGWGLLNAALAIERTGLEAHLKTRAWLDRLVCRAQASGRLDDPVFADAAVALDTRVEAGGLMAWSIVRNQARDEYDGAASAMSKWFNTELGRPIARLGIDLDGLQALVTRADGGGSAGVAEAMYREAPGLTLSAGTSEIMLFAIATGRLAVHDDELAMTQPAGAPGSGATAAADGAAGQESPSWYPVAKGREAWVAGWQSLTGTALSRLVTSGGAGLGQRGALAESVVAAEEWGYALRPAAPLATLATTELIVQTDLTGAQRPRTEAIMSGEHILVMAADPDAVRRGGRSVPVLDDTGPVLTLNGQATFIPSAPWADSLAVGAQSPAGPVLVLVSLNRAGIALSRQEEVSQDDFHHADFAGTSIDAVLCRYDDSHFGELLVKLHLRHAAYLLGMAQRAFDLTLAHAKRRRQFGRTIASFQHVSFRLASMSTSLDATRTLIRHSAKQYDRGAVDSGPLPGPVLAYTAELARDVTAEALQIHGAAGITEHAEVSRCYRLAVVAGLAFGQPRQLRQEAAGEMARRILMNGFAAAKD